MNRDELHDILLAEDNPQDLELTLRALNKYKIANQVIVVRDGAAALDYLYRRGEFANREGGNPAAVLLDLKMPKVDGIEVLRRVKSDPELKSLPVVILTSSREEHDLVRGYGLGANAYVDKPVRFDEFVEAVSLLGMFWALVNEPPSRGRGRGKKGHDLADTGSTD
jgi:CheY-like chemotaxis protein